MVIQVDCKKYRQKSYRVSESKWIRTDISRKFCSHSAQNFPYKKFKLSVGIGTGSLIPIVSLKGIGTHARKEVGLGVAVSCYCILMEMIEVRQQMVQ